MAADGQAPEASTCATAPEATADGGSRRLSLRRAPRLVARGLTLAWSVGRHRLVVILLLQIMESLGVLGLLLQARNLLTAVLAHDQVKLSATVVPAIGFVVAYLVFSTAEQLVSNRKQILGELVAWRVMERILRVSSSVELGQFDTGRFHDRLERATSSAANRPVQLVQSLANMAEDLLMVGGVFLALFAIQPVIAVTAIAGVIPVWLASIRSGEQYFDFVRHTAPMDRERSYLLQLLTRRDSAKEVRAFNLGDYLYQRWRHRSEERLAQLHQTLRRRLHNDVAGGLGIVLLLTVALAVVFTLNATGLMSLAEAATTVAAVFVLGQMLLNLIS
jgi:ABC-type multidrug transport system fused ATPase/permease subunit